MAQENSNEMTVDAIFLLGAWLILIALLLSDNEWGGDTLVPLVLES